MKKYCVVNEPQICSIFLIFFLICSSVIVIADHLEITTPCQDESVSSQTLAVIRDCVEKLVPHYNSELVAIELDTGAGLILRPTDSVLNIFLTQYYALATSNLRRKNRNQPQITSKLLLLSFNHLYLNFLNEVGAPLACISFYAGATNFSSVFNVRRLAERLETHYGKESVRVSKGQKFQQFERLNGNDLLNLLEIETVASLTADVHENPDLNSRVCRSLFWKLQNGNTIANLPTISTPPFTIVIPGEESVINTHQANVTLYLEQYFSKGLDCLDTNLLKENFSSTFSDWMSIKLVPVLLETPVCIRGFPKILLLLKSIDLFTMDLKDNIIYAVPPSPQLYYANPTNMVQDYGPIQPIIYNNRLPEQEPNSQQYASAPLEQFQPAVEREQRIKYFSQDDDAHEIYKISPKFQYRYQQEQIYKVTPSADDTFIEATPSHQHLAAGISFVALILLILFICCLLPLIYYLCRPDFQKYGKFSFSKWIRKLLTPENKNMPDFEKNYDISSAEKHVRTFPHPDPLPPVDEEPPVRQKRSRKSKNKRQAPRRTTLHIQLKETPLEMSYSEVEEETDYVSDMDFGRKYSTESSPHKKAERIKDRKVRSKSAPNTPMSPFDNFKKRFSFNNSKPSTSAPNKTKSSKETVVPPSSTTGITEDDEDVIYNRYNGKPIDDVTGSRSTQRIISSSAAARNEDDEEQKRFDEKAAEQQKRRKPLTSYNNDEETESSDESKSENNDGKITNKPKRRSNLARKTSSEEYFENHMARWDK